MLFSCAECSSTEDGLGFRGDFGEECEWDDPDCTQCPILADDCDGDFWAGPIDLCERECEPTLLLEELSEAIEAGNTIAVRDLINANDGLVTLNQDRHSIQVAPPCDKGKVIANFPVSDSFLNAVH